MSVMRALAWNTGVQLVGKVISTILGVLVISLMTRLLGQEGFGMYSAATSFFQIFAIVLDLGLAVMLAQMLGEHAGDKPYEDRLVSATFTLRIVVAAGVLTLVPILGFALPFSILPYPPLLKWALIALWASFFFSSLNQIIVGVQQRHLQMSIISVGEILGRLILLGGILLGMHQHWGLLPISAIVSLGSFANFIIIAIGARRHTSLGWNWDPTMWKTILHRSWPIGVSILFNLIYFKADTFILSLVRSFNEVGIYSLAYRVLEILITIPFMYTGVLLPLLANAWAKNDRAHFQTLFRHSLVAMFAIGIPMIGGALVLGPAAVRLIAGDAFVDAAKILNVLMIAVLLIFFGTVASHAIVAVDKQRAMLPVYAVIAIITLGGYLLFIPRYGMWAAAWLTVFSEGLVALASTFISLRASQTKLLVSPYLKVILAGLLMTLALLPFQSMWLPIPIIVGIVVYTALLFLFKILTPVMLREILTMKPKDEPTAI